MYVSAEIYFHQFKGLGCKVYMYLKYKYFDNDVSAYPPPPGLHFENLLGGGKFKFERPPPPPLMKPCPLHILLQFILIIHVHVHQSF